MSMIHQQVKSKSSHFFAMIGNNFQARSRKSKDGKEKAEGLADQVCEIFVSVMIINFEHQYIEQQYTMHRYSWMTRQSQMAA